MEEQTFGQDIMIKIYNIFLEESTILLEENAVKTMKMRILIIIFHLMSWWCMVISFSSRMKAKIFRSSFCKLVAEKTIDYMQEYESFYKAGDVLDSKNVKHAYSQALHSQGEIRGLQSTSSIAPNTVLLKLKRQGALVADACEKIPLIDQFLAPKDLKDVWNVIRKPNQRLAILLLLEYIKQDKSTICEYIRFLPSPQQFHTPLHWNAVDMESFPYEYLIESKKLQSSQWNSLYETLKAMKPEIFSKITYERFIWALEVVGSRAFTGLNMAYDQAKVFSYLGIFSLAMDLGLYLSNKLDDNTAFAVGLISTVVATLPSIFLQLSPISSIALLPYIDSANHRTEGFNGMVLFNPISSSFEMSSTKPINSGEEVNISYGNRTNDEWLLKFGFIESNNPFDAYVISDFAKKVGQCVTSTVAENVKKVNLELNLRDIDSTIERTRSIALKEFRREVTVSDAKVYLKQILKEEKENIVIYLTHRDNLPNLIVEYLSSKLSLLERLEIIFSK